MTEKIHARDQAELGFLMQYIKEAAELPGQLLKPSNELPLSALVVPLPQDYKHRDRFLTFSFVPLTEEEAEHIRLLQIFTVVPVEWKEGTRAAVERLLQAVNGRTAIGHFHVKDDGEMNFRYVYCATESTILPKYEILEVLDLFNMMLEMFSETIDKVASGELGLNEALALIQ